MKAIVSVKNCWDADCATCRCPFNDDGECEYEGRFEATTSEQADKPPSWCPLREEE